MSLYNQLTTLRNKNIQETDTGTDKRISYDKELGVYLFKDPNTGSSTRMVVPPASSTVQSSSQRKNVPPIDPSAPQTDPSAPPTNPVNPTPSNSLANISDLYGGYKSSLSGVTEQNISAAQETAQTQQSILQRQLEEQRSDYLKNRQTLQKETFLRGRNVLANLANRGLATSGLLQLGDVQRTIATGQQMTGLAEVFSRASTALTDKINQVKTETQQYVGQQQAGLATQLAGLDIQQRQAEVTESERLLGLAEDQIAAAQTAGTDEQKALITDLYSRAASGDSGALAELTQYVRENPSTVASTNPSSAYAGVDLVSAAKGSTSLNPRESAALEEYIASSDYLKTDSEIGAPIAAAVAANSGKEVSINTSKTPGGKGHLNDTFAVKFSDGTTLDIPARELIVLYMAGKVSLSPENAKRLISRKNGGIMTAAGTSGNKYDAFVRTYTDFLKSKGIIN